MTKDWPSAFLLRVKHGYRYMAFSWLNFTVLCLCFLTISYFFCFFFDGNQTICFHRFNIRAIKYLDPFEAERLFWGFEELIKNRYEYRPRVGFGVPQFHRDRINVDDANPFPIRRTVSSAINPETRDLSEPKFTIWIFGGSTVFGWGVPDEHTIPSHLQTLLSDNLPSHEVRIINHGTPSYYSSQEVDRLITALRAGHNPDLVIFFHGANEALLFDPADQPLFTKEITWSVSRQLRLSTAVANPHSGILISPQFPPARLMGWIASRVFHQTINWISFEASIGTLKVWEIPTLVARYRFNVKLAKAILKEKSIPSIFFWQPENEEVIPHWEEVTNQATQWHEPHFYSLAKIFEGKNKRDIYVDEAHYGDQASGEIAQAIVQILKQGYLPVMHQSKRMRLS